MIKQKINKKIKRGISIVEVMIAIYIISMAFIGILSLVVQNIRMQNINKNAIMASQLAQEGLELVRNQRDTNWITDSNWKLGTGNATDIVQDGTYVVDYNNGISNSASNISDPGTRLYIDGQGFYTHTVSANFSGFSRLITIINETNYSVNIECRVRWQVAGGQPRDYIAQTELYDWK